MTCNINMQTSQPQKTENLEIKINKPGDEGKIQVFIEKKFLFYLF